MLGKAGKIVLQTFLKVYIGMLIKLNCLMPVLAAFVVSKIACNEIKLSS